MAISYINNMQTDTFKKVSWRILKRADRSIPVPFELKLSDNEEPLLCEKVIRVIPKKRFVIFGSWNNQLIVAKLFIEWGKAKKHRHRDAAGIDILTSASIPTPKLLFQGTDQTKRIHVLIFERILDSCNLDILWQNKNDIDELVPLMRAVTIELATQHVLGVVQKDLHLKNFLVTSKTVFTLDGDSIEQFNGPLPKKESIEHLSLFFSQLGIGTEELRKQLFALYAQSRGWIVRPADIELLQQTTQKWSTQRWLRYQKKIMRDCSAFECIKKPTSLIIYDREYQSENFYALLKNPDQFFTAPSIQVLKSGRSSTVIKIKLDNRVLVIKRYNIKNIWHGIRRCLRQTRAITGWQLAHHLCLAGIPTAKPIACIEKSFLGLRGKSYFVMEYIEGKHLGEYFASYRPDNPQFLKIAERIVRLIHNLAKLRMTHGDLKMTNILLEHERPVLIDLDGMCEHHKTGPFKRAYKKEIQRFMKNWDNFPSVREMFKALIK